MKYTLFNAANWVLSDPRRAFVILSVIVLVATLALSVVPNGAVLAEDIVGGS